MTADFNGDSYVNGYAETIADIIEKIALFKGLTAVDIASTSFADFNTQFPMVIGAYLTHRVNTLAFVQELLDEVGGYWYFDELNKLRLWWLRAPTNNPLHIITEDDYQLGSFNIDEVESAAWKLRFGVNRNHTIQDADSLAASLTELERRKYSTEYVDIVEVADDTIKTNYLLAEEPDLYRTHWRSGSAVSPEVARQLALKATPHFVFSIRCKSYTPQTAQLALRLGDEVLVSIGRAGFMPMLNAYQLKTLGQLNWGTDPLGAFLLSSQGQASSAILVGYTEYIVSGTIEMQLWK